MSDHGSAGRMVSLVPVTWAEGFPLIGLPGNLRKAPNTWIKPNTGFTQEPKPTYGWDENFDSGKLNPRWQWTHVPDDSTWSLAEKPGALRLHSLPAADFYHARNTVCQRPPGPECIVTVELDATGMIAGDTAGLGLVSTPYVWIGVVKSAEGATLQMTTGRAPGRGRPGAQASTQTNAPTVSPSAPPQRLWLRAHCNFDNDQAIFSWSADGKKFTALGEPVTMTSTDDVPGVRPGPLHLNLRQPAATRISTTTSVRNLVPRIEREIQWVKPSPSPRAEAASGADAADNVLVNVAPIRGAVPSERQIPGHRLGKGRVPSRRQRPVLFLHRRELFRKTWAERPQVIGSFQWGQLDAR